MAARACKMAWKVDLCKAIQRHGTVGHFGHEAISWVAEIRQPISELDCIVHCTRIVSLFYIRHSLAIDGYIVPLDISDIWKVSLGWWMFINAMHLKCPFALVLIVMYALMDDEWLSFVPHLLFLQIVSDVMSCRTVSSFRVCSCHCFWEILCKTIYSPRHIFNESFWSCHFPHMTYMKAAGISQDFWS